MKNILKKRIKSVEDIYKSAMKMIEIDRGDDNSDLLLTVKTICLTEMELFDLHAISLADFIKVKISHFSGEGKIAQYNKKKYGEKNTIKYVQVLKELLKNNEI